MITGKFACAASRKIVASPAPRKAWRLRCKTIGRLIKNSPSGRTTSPPELGKESNAVWISSPVTPDCSITTTDSTVDLTGAATHGAGKLNQQMTAAVAATAPGPPICLKHVVIRTRPAGQPGSVNQCRPSKKLIHNNFEIIRGKISKLLWINFL